MIFFYDCVDVAHQKQENGQINWSMEPCNKPSIQSVLTDHNYHRDISMAFAEPSSTNIE